MPPNRIGSDSDAALIDALAARLRSFERHAAGAMVRWIEETGITVVELRVFFVLADGDAMSGVQLAEAAGLTVESTYPAMHRLAARGWASERDRRHGLTALGREKVEEFAGARRAAVADFVASLPEGERRARACVCRQRRAAGPVSQATAKPKRLVKDLWRWTERHPEWHPGEFGKEVACFAVKAGDDTLLIDPLLSEDPQPVLELIEANLGRRLTILITIPYHVRSSEELWRRFKADADTAIYGHRACAKRLSDTSGFRELEPGTQLPGGATAHRIGKPRRFEMPLFVPSHRALVFGDAVAESGSKLRVWSGDKVDDKVARFYRERFNPTLKPLLELDFDRVLVTHGLPVMKDGKRELRAALRRKPWYHHP